MRIEASSVHVTWWLWRMRVAQRLCRIDRVPSASVIVHSMQSINAFFDSRNAATRPQRYQALSSLSDGKCHTVYVVA